MRRTLRILSLACVAAAACDCGRREDVIETDLVAPFVRSVEPGGNAVAVDAAFTVTFSEPVRRDRIFVTADGNTLPDGAVLGLEKDADALESALDSPPLSSSQRGKTLAADVTLSDDRKVLTVKPQASLAFLTNYVLVVSKTIADDANNRLVDAETKKNETLVFRFQTVAEPACVDEAPPKVDPQGVTVVPGTTSVTFSWRTDEPGASQVEVFGGAPEGLGEACAANAPACLRGEGPAATCSVVVNPCELADPPQYVCERTVAMSGLKSETTYAYRLVTKDAAAHTVTGEVGTFTTLEFPKLVLNELLVTTRGIADGGNDKGKFVEIVNAGSAAVDLAGWKLARCATAECIPEAFVSTWTFQAAAEGASTLLEAGDFAVAGGNAFDPVLMGVPEGTVVVRGSSATLSLLVASTANAYALVTPDGSVISTYGAHLPPPSSGASTVRSFERKEPTGSDTAEDWAASQLAVAGAPGTFASPGRANGSGVPSGCTDTQAPQVDQGSITVVASHAGATISWKTDEGGPSTVQLFAGDAAGLQAACASGDAACLRIAVAPATCSAPVNPCALPDPPVFGCTRTATLTGLAPQTAYSFRLVSTDGAANDATGEVRQLTTLAPPKIALNEILPITRGITDSAHNKGKFVELYNGGDAPVDLAGWKFLRCADTACTPPHDNTWTLAAREAGTSVVPARGYAIAAGDEFDPGLMGVPAGVPVLKGSSATLSFLVSSTPHTYALAGPDGAVLSRYQAWLPGISSGSDTAASWERKDPFGAEAADNWASSSAPVSAATGTFATPGARNTVSTLPPACTDATAPVFDPAGPQPSPGVSIASVAWRTDENGPSEALCVKSADATQLDGCEAEGATCLRQSLAAAACNTWVDSCALPDPAVYGCTRTVSLAQLEPSSVYTCRLVAKDAAGNAATSAPVTFATQSPPKLALTEVLVTTRGIPGNDHDRGKFMEILNAGSVEVDLAGWKLARCAAADCAAFTTVWTLRARAVEGATTKVAPGRYAVAGGTEFDPTLMGVPADVVVVRGSTDTLSFVTSTTANSYALLAPTGEVVSKYGAWLPLYASSATSVKSFERRIALDPDAATNWLASTKAVTGLPNVFATPGAPNTATDAPVPCTDSAAPEVSATSVQVSVSSTGATVTWKTNEGGASEVEWVKGDAAALTTACGEGGTGCGRTAGAAATCTATLDACNLPNPMEFPCSRAVAIPGLEPSTTYSYRLVSKDAAGNVVRGSPAQFTTTAPPVVKLALSEVFASPKLPAGAASTEANKLKFVELTNTGGSDVDLAGWKLARCATGDDACAGTPDYVWTLRARVENGAALPTIVKAGGFAVVGGDTLDRTKLAIPSDATVVRGSTATILGDKLVKGDARAYALLAPDGAVHSTYGAHLGVPGATASDGKSFERVQPADADSAANWAVSTNDLSASTGAANFASPGKKNSRSP